MEPSVREYDPVFHAVKHMPTLPVPYFGEPRYQHPSWKGPASLPQDRKPINADLLHRLTCHECYKRGLVASHCFFPWKDVEKVIVNYKARTLAEKVILIYEARTLAEKVILNYEARPLAEEHRINTTSYDKAKNSTAATKVQSNSATDARLTDAETQSRQQWNNTAIDGSSDPNQSFITQTYLA